jgi:hypothetical protein
LGNTFGGFQSFSEAIGDGNSTYYTIENSSAFEIGIGTYIAQSNTLSRDIILTSTNSNNHINLSGLSIVFCTYPASSAFLLNSAGYATSFTDAYNGIRFPDGTVQNTAALIEPPKRLRSYKTFTSNGNVLSTDDLILLNSISQEVAVTMPSAASVAGYTFTFKKISGNNKCTILPQNDQKIDLKDSLEIFNVNVSFSLFSDSNNWYII